MHDKTFRGRTRKLLVPVVAMGSISGGVLAVSATPAHAATVNVAKACSIYSNVSLFGGTAGSQGCGPQSSSYSSSNSLAPSATMLSGGGTINNVDSDGAMLTYGPANIVSSPYDSSDNTTNTGVLTAQTSWNGSTGNVSALAQAKAIGPSPFWTKTPTSWQTAADIGHVKTTCSSTSTTNNATVEIKNGVVDLALDPDTGYPTSQQSVATNPSQGLSYNFTIDTVSEDEWGYIVFNERTTNADGSLTVVGAHMYMMGPIAVGEVKYGEVTCGKAA
jgi:hypothetical protein